MPQHRIHFGICPLCEEVNPYGSEIVTWRPCSEDQVFIRPKEIKCGFCGGVMEVESWKPTSTRPALRLKTWPQSFEDIRKGLKTYDMRRNDRNFQTGDKLILCEYEPHQGQYTERELHCTVVHMTHGGRQGLPKGYCILGLFLHGSGH